MEQKPEKATKSKVTRKSPARGGSDDRPIAKLNSELRKHCDTRKKTDLAILDIRRELKDLLLVTPLNYQRSSKTRWHG